MQEKKNKELNELGYPVDDPYGLAEAWWTIFTKPEVEEEKCEKNTKIQKED